MSAETQPNQGMVIFTDGGCGPTNPGYMGYGVHGYLYNDEKPKKGAGIPTHVLTSKGYVSKTTVASQTATQFEQVTPISYFDGVGSVQEFGTNNVAEMLAVRAAVQKALEFAIKRLTIVSDSEYVLKSITEWSNAWIRNNWIRQDGSPVPNADLWKTILQDIAILKDRGVELHWVWVRGHGDGTDNSYGNLIVDDYATIGKAYSAKGKVQYSIQTTAADGYWKSEVSKHPFLAYRSMYFSTNKDTQVPGEYYIGNQSKEDELLGKRISDGAYGVVQLVEPEPILEYVRTYQSDNSGEYERLVKAQVDNIYSTAVYDKLLNHGEFYLTRYRPNSFDVRTLGKAPIVDVLDPPLISARTFDCVAALKAILMAYRTDEMASFEQTDITDVLYSREVVTKKNKEVTEVALKPEYNVGFSALKVTVNVKTPNGKLNIPITMTLGIDIPDRNTLKRLEADNIKVVVLTWSDAPDVFRYATVIQYKEDYSIWCGYYSNIVFIHEAIAKSA